MKKISVEHVNNAWSSMCAPHHRSLHCAGDRRIHDGLAITAGHAACAGFTGHLSLEVHGGQNLLVGIGLWGHVPRVLETTGRKGNMEDGGGAASAILLLAGHARQVLDGGATSSAWTSGFERMHHL